jgi:hypothetical protein
VNLLGLLPVEEIETGNLVEALCDDCGVLADLPTGLTLS